MSPRRILLLSLMIVNACADSGGGPPPPGPHPSLAGMARPLIVGHGGAKRLCAENTLSCFQMAIDLGAQAMEADLQVLGDGTLVMFHDDSALGQTGEDLALLDLTLEQARALDLGWAFSPDDGQTHPLRGQGLTVATFTEFLEAFPGLPVLLDVKPESAEMAGALEAFVTRRFIDEWRRRVYIKVNNSELAAKLRALDPPPFVAFTSGERAKLLLAPETVEGLPPSWIDLGGPQTTAGTVTWAHGHDHVITSSTIDEIAEMEQLLADLEIDGIVTNYPDRLKAVLGR